MARAKKQEKKKGGPYLAAAFFCETTIEDKQDGALSAIRMLDQIILKIPAVAPVDPSSEERKIPVSVSGLLSFKSGDFPGDHRIRLVMESPSGKSQVAYEQTLPFTPPPQGGANLRLNHTILVKKGGLFWMNVFLDGKRVTRMPLLISVQRPDAASAPAE